MSKRVAKAFKKKRKSADKKATELLLTKERIRMLQTNWPALLSFDSPKVLGPERSNRSVNGDGDI